MEDSFKIDQNLIFREFFNATLYVYITGKRLRNFVLILLGINLLSLFLNIAASNNHFNFLKLISTIAPFIIMLLIFFLFTLFICLYIHKTKPYLFENVSYEFTHWGVVRNGKKTEFSKPWRDISKFKETKEFFLLYVANTDFHIIQKRMFKDFDEIERFRSLLIEKIA